MTFSSLGLSESMLAAVARQGYKQPSPIQSQAIPAILAGKDVTAAAQTGTGKTAAFVLPLLQRLAEGEPSKDKRVRALILTPTRELAHQVNDSVFAYGKKSRLRSAVVYGGVRIGTQIGKLRRGVDVLVATPGRLLDLHRQDAVDFSALEMVVLDEADRMLDMGFIDDIRTILDLLPSERQSLLFSATLSDKIRKLAKRLANNPLEISVNRDSSTVKTVKQWIHPVDKSKKGALLVHLIQAHQWQQALVFTKTKHGADRLARRLNNNDISAVSIHGGKSQGQRMRALNCFKKGTASILVATDVAARGLDIDAMPRVVNVDLPTVAEDYVHRIGRTGRAGALGQALSLVSADEHRQLVAIEKLIKQQLERKLVDEFEPEHNLPSSSAKVKPDNAKPSSRRRRRPRPGARARSKEGGGRSSESRSRRAKPARRGKVKKRVRAKG